MNAMWSLVNVCDERMTLCRSLSISSWQAITRRGSATTPRRIHTAPAHTCTRYISWNVTGSAGRSTSRREMMFGWRKWRITDTSRKMRRAATALVSDCATCLMATRSPV